MKFLTSIAAIVQSMVELPNGETTKVTRIGTVTLSSQLTLTNVLCAHSFSFNLLLVSTITKSTLLPCFSFFLLLYTRPYMLQNNWSGPHS